MSSGAAYEHAVAVLADVLKQAAHWGSTHGVPVDAYIESEAGRVVDAILAAVESEEKQ